MIGKSSDDRPLHSITSQANRKLAERDNPASSPLRGFSTFGMIGWSIVVPTVGGAFLGLWLDEIVPQKFSWTIALILGGVAMGGTVAWAWIDKENK